MTLVRSLPVIIDWKFEQGTWRLIEFSDRLTSSGISVQLVTRKDANQAMHTKPSIGRYDLR